ncbi:MAG: hypothetical protein ACUVTR_00950 [Dehalococcoidia bacterium]
MANKNDIVVRNARRTDLPAIRKLVLELIRDGRFCTEAHPR